jgi:glycerophosphoryl diester phosphodiesterase
MVSGGGRGAGRVTGAPGLIIAHRGANSPEALARAGGHADVVEADVHLYRGRLEVRHAKVLWPLPVLWERWYLLDRDTPRPLLGDLLPLIGPDMALMLDLKGPDPRLPRAILDATREVVAERGLIVSGRVWRTIDRLRDTPGVTTLHSVGSPRELRALLRRGAGTVEGVSIHRRLLTPAVVAALRGRADQVWSWPVDDAATAAELGAWGVTGFISDTPERLTGR